MLSKKVFSPLNKLKRLFKADGSEKFFLVFFRLAISFIALIEIASLIKDLPLLFSSSETLIPKELIYIESGYFKYLNPLYQFLENNELSETFHPTVVTIYVLSLIFLLLGLCTRYVAGIALIFQLIIFRSFVPFNYGYDYFLTMSLFYCFIFPIGYFLSTDNFFLKSSLKLEFNYRRVLQIHLAMAYCFSGIAKGLDVGWWNGNSVWKALASADNNYYTLPSEIFLVIGIGTIMLEFFYPILVFNKKTRKYAITTVIFMHVGIAIMMDLYAFSALMIVWNVAAYSRLTSKEIVVSHVQT